MPETKTSISEVLSAVFPRRERRQEEQAAGLPSLTFIEAMEHDLAWGPFFRASRSWDAWKTMLRAFFGLPPGPGDMERYQRHTKRSQWPSSRPRELWLICGRRAGKSRIIAAVGSYLAAWGDYSQHLAPGEYATVPIIAADRKEARTIMGYISAFLKVPAVPVRILAPEEVKPTTEMIYLSNRAVIEIHTSNFRTVRGYTLVAAICDEIAFWRSEETSRNPDREILRALRPGLATIPGAPLLCLSSPYAKRGELWNTYRDYFGRDDPSVLVWQAESSEMNPTLDRDFIRREIERDPEAARSEWLGQFRDDVTGFVPVERLRACVDVGVTERPPQQGVYYRATVDPSGGIDDSMTLCIYHQDARTGNLVVDLLREARAPFSPAEVVRDFAAHLAAYGVASVVGDRYGGEWPRERFAEHGIVYHVADESKHRAYMHLLAAVMDGRVRLLDNARLLGQIESLERRARAVGGDIVDHPPGGHDDVANVVALATMCTPIPEVAFHPEPPNLDVPRTGDAIEQVEDRLAAAGIRIRSEEPQATCANCAFFRADGYCSLRLMWTSAKAVQCEMFAGRD
jgi:hypothetical protein